MRFDNSSHRRLPPSRGKLPIKNNCRLLLPVLGINILSQNFVFVNLSRYVRKALFPFSKVLAVLFTVYVSERYLDNRPVFRQTKTVRHFLFFTCGHFGEPGFTPQVARCTVSFS